MKKVRADLSGVSGKSVLQSVSRLASQLLMISFLKLSRAASAADAVQNNPVGKRTPTKRLKGALLYGLFLLFSVMGIILVIELVLLVAFLLTGSESLETLVASHDYFQQRAGSDYPADPDQYVKLAVFGGSAAAGAFTPRSFDQMIEFELRRRFPKKKIFVKNYALSGYPFHRHQAEYVKLLIKKYDFFLIYCGNNEAENWFDDSGYWRHPEYRAARDLNFVRPLESQSLVLMKLHGALEQHSRIYALVTRGKNAFWQIGAPISKNKTLDFEEFEERPALPAQQHEKLVANFTADVQEICRLARRYDKQVLLSVSATHELWPPCYSFFRHDITASEKQHWQDHYQAGLREYEKQQYADAIASFQAARQIDSGVAILNHRIGLCCLKLGRQAEGRRFLRTAIDQDGFYSRSITPLHDAAQQLSQKHEQLHYVDVVAAFHTATQGDIDDEDLFMDFCHPTFLGHVIMSRVFLDQLMQLEPFRSASAASVDQPLPSVDWHTLAKQYEFELGVTGNQWTTEIAKNILWHFTAAHFTAYRQRCYQAIDQRIITLENVYADEVDGQVYAKLSRARLALVCDRKHEALENINLAHRTSRRLVQVMLRMEAFDHYIQDEFDRAGIVFSNAKNEYVLQR